MDPIELRKRIEAAAASGNASGVIALVRNEQAKRFASDIRMARFGLWLATVLCASFGAVLVVTALRTSGGLDLALAFGGLVLLVIAAVLGAFAAAVSPPPTELAHSGIAAKATVEDYRSAFGSFSVGDERSGRRSLARVAIDLAVTPSGGTAYRVTIKQHLPMSDFAALRVGATVDAFVDRANPGRILLVLA